MAFTCFIIEQITIVYLRILVAQKAKLRKFLLNNNNELILLRISEL